MAMLGGGDTVASLRKEKTKLADDHAKQLADVKSDLETEKGKAVKAEYLRMHRIQNKSKNQHLWQVALLKVQRKHAKQLVVRPPPHGLPFRPFRPRLFPARFN